MSKVKNIIDSLKNQGIKTDKAQIKLIDKLIKISHDERCFILNLLSKKKNKGIYIWSDVGRGKTVVVKEFLKNTNHKNVKCFHYISFINFIHDQLNKNSGLKDPLKQVTDVLTKNCSLIFLDEFQVEDVADAMMIGDLLNRILKTNTKLIFTSNSHPSDIYKDGLQRQKFMNYMNILIDNVEVFKLDGKIDYRTQNIIRSGLIGNNESFDDKKIISLIEDSFGKIAFSSDKIVVKNRKLNCKLVKKNIIWIEFISFFTQPTGPIDYKFIINKYDWVFISNFHRCNDDSKDIIRRFISFIDIAYANKTKIKFFFNEIEIAAIYDGLLLDHLWKRCESRLMEMNNRKYFDET